MAKKVTILKLPNFYGPDIYYLSTMFCVSTLLIADLNQAAPTSTADIYNDIHKLEKNKYRNNPWLSPPLTSQILRDGLFEGLPPDAQFVRSEVR